MGKTINEILGGIKETNTKLASENAPSLEKLAAQREQAQHALDGVLAGTTSTKVASDAGAQFAKVASEIADIEQAAQIKEAQVYGAAVADGFMQRMNQYAAGNEKVAQNFVQRGMDAMGGLFRRGGKNVDEGLEGIHPDQAADFFVDTIEDVSPDVVGAPLAADARNQLRRRAMQAGAGGLAGAGMLAGGAYGMGDADTPQNRMRQMANQHLGTDFETESRFANMMKRSSVQEPTQAQAAQAGFAAGLEKVAQIGLTAFEDGYSAMEYLFDE